MKNLEQMKSKIFQKEMSEAFMKNTVGGNTSQYTGTCCEQSKVYQTVTYDCSDKDDDSTSNTGTGMTNTGFFQP